MTNDHQNPDSNPGPGPNAGPGPVRLAGPADFVWLLFRFDGRISRQAYWLSILLLWCILFVIVSAMIATVGEETTEGMLLVFAIPSFWLQMAILVKRQHDRGLPWFWCLLSFVPIAGILWMIAMGVVPGEPGPNAYGDEPDRRPS